MTDFLKWSDYCMYVFNKRQYLLKLLVRLLSAHCLLGHQKTLSHSTTIHDHRTFRLKKIDRKTFEQTENSEINLAAHWIIRFEQWQYCNVNCWVASVTAIGSSVLQDLRNSFFNVILFEELNVKVVYIYIIKYDNSDTWMIFFCWVEI